MNFRDLALLIGVGAVALLVLGYAGKKQLGAAADTVGGVLSGDNALTADSPYAGAGLLGTLGAATNAVSGGTLRDLGEWLGSNAYDVFH